MLEFLLPGNCYNDVDKYSPVDPLTVSFKIECENNVKHFTTNSVRMKCMYLEVLLRGSVKTYEDNVAVHHIFIMIVITDYFMHQHLFC